MKDEEERVERVERFRELFTLGKEFTEELLQENQRLRLRVAKLEGGAPAPEGGEIQLLRERVERLSSENQKILDTFRTVEELNREYASRYAEIEEQNHHLASLYVASYQLHSTLNLREVIGIIKEIIINLIGAETFAIMLLDEQTRELRTISAEGARNLPGLEELTVKIGEGAIGTVAARGINYYTEENVFGLKPSADGPIAVVPLTVDEQMIGLIAIFSLQEQKQAFTSVDSELFSLLAAHAAAAIFSSRLFSQSERKLNTLQSFLDLLTAP